MPARSRSWIAAAAALLAVGCADGPDVRPVKVRPGDTYRAPTGNFSVVVPPLLGRDLHESQSTAADLSASGVSLGDDFGTLLDVRSQRLPVEGVVPVAFASQVRPDQLDRYVDDRVLPAVRAASPSAQVLSRAHVTTPAGDGVFVVVHLADGGPSTHPEVVRGIVVFAQLRWAYAVTVQQWPPTPNQPPLAPADRDARLLSDLRQAVGQMTFD